MLTELDDDPSKPKFPPTSISIFEIGYIRCIVGSLLKFLVKEESDTTRNVRPGSNSSTTQARSRGIKRQRNKNSDGKTYLIMSLNLPISTALQIVNSKYLIAVCRPVLSKSADTRMYIHTCTSTRRLERRQNWTTTHPSQKIHQ